MGIGTFMFVKDNTYLKVLWYHTRCFSDIHRQRASSSVIIFITFMDEVIDILKEKCIDQPIIINLHCLHHALGLSRNLFINKCNNIMHSKKRGKSGYIIINARKKVLKIDLKLTSVWHFCKIIKNIFEL